MNRRDSRPPAADVVEVLQAPATPRELRGQDRAVAGYRAAVDRRRAAHAAHGGVLTHLDALSSPDDAHERRPARRRSGLRVLAAAGPLTAAAAVVAVAAVAVPAATGLFSRDGRPSVEADVTVASSTAPERDVDRTRAPRPTPTGTVSPAGPSPSAVGATPAVTTIVGERSTVAKPTVAATRPAQSASAATSAAARTSDPARTSDGNASGKAGPCRTWLLVAPGNPVGEQMLAQLSDVIGDSGDRAAAADAYCRALVGRDPPRCLADGSFDSSALKGRPGWRDEPLYSGWCLGVTGHGWQMCSMFGCPPVWWRCPSWGCTDPYTYGGPSRSDGGYYPGSGRSSGGTAVD